MVQSGEGVRPPHARGVTGASRAGKRGGEGSHVKSKARKNCWLKSEKMLVALDRAQQGLKESKKTP